MDRKGPEGTEGIGRDRKGPEGTGKPFQFVECIGIIVPFRRLNFFHLTCILSSECYNIFNSVPFRKSFHFEH